MVYNFFEKKREAGMSVNKALAQELHKITPVFKKSKRRKVYAGFKNNIWAADLAKMKSLYSFNRGVKYLLCVIDVFTKYSCVKQDKKSKIVLHESKRKPNKMLINEKNYIIDLCKTGRG